MDVTLTMTDLSVCDGLNAFLFIIYAVRIYSTYDLSLIILQYIYYPCPTNVQLNC